MPGSTNYYINNTKDIDKGNGVLVEEELGKPVKVKRRDQRLAQIKSDAELAQRLHEEELAELDRAQKDRKRQEEATNAALAEEFDEIQGRMDADNKLVPKVIKEQESAVSDEEAAPDYEQEKEELRMWLTVVPDEEETVDPEILSTKYPIIDWESQNLGSVDMEDLHVYKIIRAGGNTSYHKTLSSMLRKFDRQYLVDLHRLVMKRFKDKTPEGYDLLLLGDLKEVPEGKMMDSYSPYAPNRCSVVWERLRVVYRSLEEQVGKA
uniref:Uncharacterized protein n=1 Tax=Tanacetum cinerariifolium TaxID=118510 RepID=A0A6L2MUX9_TANCI|nr:hypothetical protein [Tanacetum cinerariifolium]